MEVIKMSNNTKYVRDAFKSLELVEDKEFDLFGKDSFEELGDFIEDEDDVPVEQEVIDLDAEAPEELKDSYVGDVILGCPVCHTNLFKAVDDVVIDEETELCCVGEACPVCGQEDGFKVIGKVAPFEEAEEKEETEVEVETEPDEAEVEVKEKVRESFRQRRATKKLQEQKLGRSKRILKEKVCKDCGKEVCECDGKKVDEAKWESPVTGEVVDVPTFDVTDQVIVKRGEPGFISKMHKLRDQGYKCISSGDGQMCFAKPKELKTEKCEALTESKHDLQKLPQDIQDIVGEHFGYTMDFDFLDIVADVLLRIDDFEEAVDNDGIVLDTVDDTLIYIDDQWEVLRYYFDSPSDLDSESWDTAFTNFASDIERVCAEVVAQRGGEELTESADPKILAKVRKDIEKAKNKLKGKKPRENFGEKEVRALEDKYFEYRYGLNHEVFDLIHDFEDWCGRYTGLDESLTESKPLRKYYSYKITNGDLTDTVTQVGEYMYTIQHPNKRYVKNDRASSGSDDRLFTADQVETYKNGMNMWIVDESVSSPTKGKKLSEAPIYDLNPQFDSRKSFYSKAKVDTGYKGDKNKLYSYGTLVAELEDGKPVVYGTFSSTTLRHIKDWLKQLGFKADNAKQIMADYGVKDENRSVRRPGRKVNESLEDIKSEWENMRSENIFEFPSGDYVYVGIDFDKKTIYAGGATNTGIFRDTEIDLDEDDSLYGNLERLYDTISEEHPEYLETDESLKSDGKPLTESGKEQITVKWGDVFNERQQGRLAALKGQKIDRGTAEQISNAVASHLAKKNFELKDLMPKIDFDNETFICNVEKEKEMSLGEAIENATIETEDQVINLSAETKDEDMNADWFDRESMGEGELLPDGGEEMIAPLDDADIQEIEDAQQPEEETAEETEVETGEEEVPQEAPEEMPEEEEEEAEEVQEESFKRIAETYLKKVYSNVKSFEIDDKTFNEGLLTIDGTIEFNSGKKKTTTFVFEAVNNNKTIAKSKKEFVGLNETFTDKKDAFVLATSINDKKLVAESLSYDYPAKTKDLNESVKTVKGIVK